MKARIIQITQRCLSAQATVSFRRLNQGRRGYKANPADLLRLNQLFNFGRGRAGWHIGYAYIYHTFGGVVCWERNT